MIDPGVKKEVTEIFAEMRNHVSSYEAAASLTLAYIILKTMKADEETKQRGRPRKERHETTGI